jgi:hypothetical protein
MWSVVAMAVILGYHIAEPISVASTTINGHKVMPAHLANTPAGMTSITINGHTYFGNPPAPTLFQRDQVSFIIVIIVLVAGLVASTIDLVMRIVRRSHRPGTVAVIAGVAVALFSLFGFLWGGVSVGVVGVLLIFAGLPTRGKNVK